VKLGDSVYHSVSLVRIVAGQRVGTTFARFLDTDGDTVVGETTIAPTEMTWRFLEGSGKWKDIRGWEDLVDHEREADPSRDVPGVRAGDRDLRDSEVAPDRPVGQRGGVDAGSPKGAGLTRQTRDEAPRARLVMTDNGTFCHGAGESHVFTGL